MVSQWRIDQVLKAYLLTWAYHLNILLTVSLCQFHQALGVHLLIWASRHTGPYANSWVGNVYVCAEGNTVSLLMRDDLGFSGVLTLRHSLVSLPSQATLWWLILVLLLGRRLLRWLRCWVHGFCGWWLRQVLWFWLCSLCLWSETSGLRVVYVQSLCKWLLRWWLVLCWWLSPKCWRHWSDLGLHQTTSQESGGPSWGNGVSR